jgi:hypothetical protein
MNSFILSWRLFLPLDPTYPDTFVAWKQWIHWHPDNRCYPYRLRRRIDEHFQRIQMWHWKEKTKAIDGRVERCVYAHIFDCSFERSRCAVQQRNSRTWLILLVGHSDRLILHFRRLIIGWEQIVNTYVFTFISNRFQVLIHRIDQCDIRYTNTNLSSVQCL